MKRIILILAAVIACVYAVQGRTAAERETLWNEANTLYLNGDYRAAISVYESIADEGFVSAKLYYNLGNAYFKDNSIGKAIVNYHRALRLSPSDKDTEYNLAVANSYVKDRIEAVPDFFLKGWANKVRSVFNSNVWAVVSLVMLAGALAFALVYMLARKKSLRKTGFFAALTLAVLFIASLSFSISERRELSNASGAIVTTSAVSVRSSPDSASKDLFILHEGTKVQVLNRFGSWAEIMIADGNKGWLPASAVEQI